MKKTLSRTEAFKEFSSSRIMVLDGAMGTMIQRMNLDEDAYGEGQRGNNEALVFTRPEVIRSIHRAYLEAGAHIIETNTFNANVLSQKDYAMEGRVYDMNFHAARIAREACELSEMETGIPRFTAGSIGPTSKSASLPSRVDDPEYREADFDILRSSYALQIEGLADGGADLLLFETFFDALNCKAALFAAREVLARKGLDLPLMVSATIADSSGRTLTGQTLEAFYRAVEPFGLFSFGVNCSFGASGLFSHVKALRETVSCALSVHPNAGLPDSDGSYTQDALSMEQEILPFLSESLVQVIGGCCGTTPEHIGIISRAAEKFEVCPLPEKDLLPAFSGLEQLKPEGRFITVGERTNAAGSKRFLRLVRQELWDEVMSIGSAQVEAGAQIIDLCMDDSMLDGTQSMVSFLRRAALESEISKVPIMIDSSRWEILEAGLKNLQGKGIVNSISLKEGEELFIRRAHQIRSYGAAMVVMLFDETGQADTYERKIEVAGRSYKLLVQQEGIPPSEIIIDPNVLAVATGIEEHDRYALDFLESVSWIKEHLPGVLVSGGVSNLSFSFRGNQGLREAMHTVFLYHAVSRGLDMAIIQPSMKLSYDQIDKHLLDSLEDVLLFRRPDALQRLLEHAKEFSDTPEKHDDSSRDWRSLDVGRRLSYSVLRGVTAYLKEDIEEAVNTLFPAVKIIEGPLMDGMDEVGKLFGDGKMFLPQVVKSARVMKEASSLLEPYITKEMPDPAAASGKILLATVKGDVHDIGKNLTAVVLRCSRYEVIDLGVMVAAERIAEAVHAHSPDIIGLSGLITPSLDEMVHTAKVLAEQGISVPVMIGGATTSGEYTRKRIQPVYPGPVVHVKDASLSIQAASRIMSGTLDPPDRKEKAVETTLVSLEQARREARQLHSQELVIPKLQGVITPDPIPLADLYQYINWNMLLAAWKVPRADEQARETLDDAIKLFEKLSGDQELFPQGLVGLFPVRNYDDDVVVYNPGTIGDAVDTAVPLGVLHFLRRQSGDSRSLSDYLLSGVGDDLTPREDYIGLFVVTSGKKWQELSEQYRESGDDYTSLMISLIADRVVEAASEYLHMKVRREWWGYAEQEQCSPAEMIRGQYRGIRPAVGYPACPDHTEKEIIFTILGARKALGVNLTRSYAMDPPSSVCGYYFASPDAAYFSIGTIGEDQKQNYAGRKGWTMDQTSRWLAPLLN